MGIRPENQKKIRLSNLGLEPRIFRLGVGRGSHFARPTIQQLQHAALGLLTNVIKENEKF